MGTSDRRLLAILAADVVGYSRLIEADEAGTLKRLKNFRLEVTDPSFATHHGRIIKVMGDGVLVAFDSIVDAVGCAADIQKAAADRNTPLLEAERLVLRIGVNLGDVALLDGDVYGDGVNIAARLEQLCDPGGVLISGTAFDQLQGKIDLPFEFLGEQQVKNITRPVRLYNLRRPGIKHTKIRTTARFPAWRRLAITGVVLLCLALGGVWWMFQPNQATAKSAIAVLPFTNYGGDEASGRLADGLTEDIITDLARFREFDVVARNSTDIYKGKTVEIREVAKALKVGYVLEGSIQRNAGRVRITAQLLDSAGNHLWSERWDRPDHDVFAVQTEIAQHVSNQLAGGVSVVKKAERDAARRKRPDNLSAYELYLLGSEKTEQPSPENMQAAIPLLSRALELDPALARAWTSLSQAYDVLAWAGIDTENSRKKAFEAAQRAVTLDPNDADARVALANCFGAQNDFIRAKAEYDTALRLAPSSATILTQYANWAASLGDAKRGGEMADQARKLDPNFPMWAATRFAAAYFAADRYEDALQVLEPTNPDDYAPDIWVIRPSSLAAVGRVEEAKTWVKEALKKFPDLTAEGWANEPSYSLPERQRFLRLMALAGFPPCAKREVLSKTDNPLRLEACKK